MNPQRNQLGKANKAMRNAASKELNENMGKFSTGPHTAKGRKSTRADQLRNSLKDQEK